ncbi:MAG: helix-turn-helix transcriptional regulator [Rhodocyclaceae bacterium]|nr:helix-turn-helix transcriptional regulator [Rhodocyclaceae bacterium]
MQSNTYIAGRLTVNLACDWRIADGEGRHADARMFAALTALAETGSLQGAARRMGVSYRHLWGRLQEWSELLGAPLAHLEKGRGARLTPFAERVLEAERRVAQELAPRLAALSSELTRLLQALAPGAVPVLTLAASHDLVLVKLRELAGVADGFQLNVQFRGSAEALRELGNGHCEFAGFHVPGGRLAHYAGGMLRGVLSRQHHRVVEIMQREQGLMLPAGNPQAVAGLRDLVTRPLKFVNRQVGSGTRLLFDGLLRDEGLDPARIAGYDEEEFTHVAVAATVASGMAQAGFGLRAAADQFGLDFITLAYDRYFLAAAAATWESEPGLALRVLLASPRVQDLIDGISGYRALRDVVLQLPEPGLFAGSGNFIA